MRYFSTRNKENLVTASQAILRGIADDGGLYVPENIPLLPPLESLSEMDYRELAFDTLRLYLTDYTDDEILSAVNGAYDDKFETPEIVPIKEAGGAYFLELFRGPTLAFKDMALTMLPYLLKTALSKQGEKREVVILTATSGDTGKAALEGFKDVDGTRVIVFFPENGVSQIQRLQMLTQRGRNTNVAAVKGSFDDAQGGVKEIFNDTEFNALLQDNGYMLSSANSINIGRLLPQVVYYVYGYMRLAEKGKIVIGDKINIVVPTGNFGNILAAYYAMRMGLPVGRLICASNDNRVLTDFFKEGGYDRRRKLMLTSSPSMDILVSSNLERYLFHISGGDTAITAQKMKELESKGFYDWDLDKLGPIHSGMANEDQVSSAIKSIQVSDDYIIDPHTAVAYSVYNSYKKETGDETCTLIASTASPFKFSEKVMDSLGEDLGKDEFRTMERLSELMHESIPTRMSELEKLPIVHKDLCDRGSMRNTILKMLKGELLDDKN